MYETHGRIGHDSRQIADEFNTKVRSRLREITEQAYEEKQQGK